MNSMHLIIFCLISLNLIFSVFCEKRTCVVILHGRGESITNGLAHRFANDLRSVLTNKSIPNYDVIEVGLSSNSDEDYDWSSFKPMDFQLNQLCQYINNHTILELQENCTRIHLVGCSQGALLMRGLLWGECLDSVAPKIDKLITFGGPNNGIFGIPDCDLLKNGQTSFLYSGCTFLKFLLRTTKTSPYIFDRFIYGAQSVLSFASYWNSPSDPLRLTTFLADINNENLQNKTKYLSEKVKALVLISFENDHVVSPAISASFGYWNNEVNDLIPFNKTEFYQQDWFGLRTLDENNSISLKTIPNTTHMDIPLSFINEDLFSYI